MKRFIPYICVIVLVIIIGAVIFPFFARSSGSQLSSCPSNLKQIALAIQLYSSDYEGHIPLEVSGAKKVGWSQIIQPYLYSYSVFQCPEEKHTGQEEYPRLPGFTDYWMNSNLSEVDAETLQTSNRIILLGDGDGAASASTASYAINQIPIVWRTLQNSPSKRHVGGANYAFVDGHVKWLKPAQVSQLPISKKNPVYTFSIR
jgi:prepilin-type processing-associated H-X9-DG protein